MACGGGELQSSADVEIDGVELGERRRDSAPAKGFRQGPEPHRARFRLDDQQALRHQSEACKTWRMEAGTTRRDPDDRPAPAEMRKQDGCKAKCRALIGRPGYFMDTGGWQAAAEQPIDGFKSGWQTGGRRERLCACRAGLDGADPIDQFRRERRRWGKRRFGHDLGPVHPLFFRNKNAFRQDISTSTRFPDFRIRRSG